MTERLNWNLHEIFPWYLQFLEEISSLSYSIVFLSFFALITEAGFLISPCYSLGKNPLDTTVDRSPLEEME